MTGTSELKGVVCCRRSKVRSHIPETDSPETTKGMTEDSLRKKLAEMDINIDVQTAVLKASASVVSVASLLNEKVIFFGSGTIIDSKDDNGSYFSTILTSAVLLKSSLRTNAVPKNMKINVYTSTGRLFDGKIYAFDFHYNIAAITIESDEPFPTASLKLLNDCSSIDPNKSCYPRDQSLGLKSFQLHSHSDSFNLCPGEMVVAIGRSFGPQYDLIVASGKFSSDVCRMDCSELLRADCRMPRCGSGGPLINRYGEVIGVNSHGAVCTPFLPINIAIKCLEHFKKHGRYNRPRLGMRITNLYATNVDKLFSNISKGVIVEEVIPESPADHAGVHRHDVIVQCNEKSVQSVLELLGMIWDKTGDSVELAVIRGEDGSTLNLKIVVDDTSPDKFNSEIYVAAQLPNRWTLVTSLSTKKWPLPEWVRRTKFKSSTSTPTLKTFKGKRVLM